MVILALGAVESARMALVSVPGVPNGNQMGANFMVHLRKNVSFTAPWPAGLVLKDQELSALLVRCRANLTDGTPVHFHLQITASAVPAGPSGGGRSDSLLFQSVPDLDDIHLFSQTAPKQVDVSIRAVGEMVPNVGTNSVAMTRPVDNDEFGVPRVTVNVVRSARDNETMGFMDAAKRVGAWVEPIQDRSAGERGHGEFERRQYVQVHEHRRQPRPVFGDGADVYGIAIVFELQCSDCLPQHSGHCALRRPLHETVEHGLLRSAGPLRPRRPRPGLATNVVQVSKSHGMSRQSLGLRDLVGLMTWQVPDQGLESRPNLNPGSQDVESTRCN
jgi:hypothetical protein